MATVHEARVRVQELIPRETALRGFLGMVKWTLAHIRQRSYGSMWSFDFGSASFDTVASYDTGTVDVTNGDTAITGNSTVWTSAMTGRKIRINNIVYTFTYVSGTSGTLDKSYVGDTDTAVNYIIYQDIYALDGDSANDVRTVERLWDETNEVSLSAQDTLRLKSLDNSTATSSVRTRYYSLEGRDSSNNPQLRVWPYPTDVARIRYFYTKRHTVPTAVGDTIDLPSYMDECFHQGVYSRALQVLRSGDWRDERNEFLRMLEDQWVNDQPLRDQIIRFHRMEVPPPAFWKGNNTSLLIQG